MTTLNVHYSFLNQAVEVPTLRDELRRLLRSNNPPQLLLRIGLTEGKASRAVRCPIETVVDPA